MLLTLPRVGNTSIAVVGTEIEHAAEIDTQSIAPLPLDMGDGRLIIGSGAAHPAPDAMPQVQGAVAAVGRHIVVVEEVARAGFVGGKTS